MFLPLKAAATNDLTHGARQTRGFTEHVGRQQAYDRSVAAFTAVTIIVTADTSDKRHDGKV